MSNSLWDHGCTPPGSSVHGISQARILEWFAISFSRGSSWPRNWTCVSLIGRQVLYHLSHHIFCYIRGPFNWKKCESNTSRYKTLSQSLYRFLSRSEFQLKVEVVTVLKLKFNKYWHSFYERMCFPTFPLFSLKTYPILTLAKDSFYLAWCF